MSIEAFKDKSIANIPVLKGEPQPFKGEICFSTVCPGEGWVECDGKNGTVDTRETRLFGAPNDASLGKRINDTFGKHYHLITEHGGINYHQAYIKDIQVSGDNEIKAKTTDETDFIYDVFEVGDANASMSADYTRSTTYYLMMWMYIGG